MTRLVFRFPGGHYHATPWGHHVNEGLVEWPPGPWRLLRAFIATAFTRLGVPDPVPGEHPLRRLIHDLAGALPTYVLPPAVSAHTRHYMPLGTLDKGSDKRTLVLDTRAVVGEGLLVVSWPVELTPECRGLLAAIASQMGYLGRAESWVEARLLGDDEPLPPGSEAVPHAEGMARGPGWEQVSLLAPVSHAAYARWRADAAAAAAADPSPAVPPAKPPRRKTAAGARAAADLCPADLFECLTRDTAWLQKCGWGQPPGSSRVLYWRRSDCLATAPPPRAPRRREPPPVEAVVLALASDTRHGEVLPLFSRCLAQAELLHRALVGRAAAGGRAPPAALTGKTPDGRPLTGHRHLHILPLCIDRRDDRFLDHFLLWAPMGLDAAAQRAIRRLRQVWTKGAEDLRVTVAGMGGLADLAALVGSRTLGPATVWVSITPFVPPRFLKTRGANTLLGQVQAELTTRGLPPAEVEVLTREEIVRRRLHRFVRLRREPAKAPPQNCFFGLRLRFAEPVPGPVCLGYASHFGLGLFSAET